MKKRGITRQIVMSVAARIGKDSTNVVYAELPPAYVDSDMGYDQTSDTHLLSQNRTVLGHGNNDGSGSSGTIVEVNL